MFVSFLYELRRRKVPVGLQEAIALAEAMSKGLHDSSLDGFYYLARALLVHAETHLDAFDQAFAETFRGAPAAGLQLHAELLAWLKEAAKLGAKLTDEQRELLQGLDWEEIQKAFEERLRQQTERHDGGNYWIGTAGTSPFGNAGQAPKGLRVGGSGGQKSALQVADARQYQPYRKDLTLDVRQLSVALRKLRAFAREGALEELDLEGTIDATAKNAGELEVVQRPLRRSNTRVVLLMDVGGSMDPYAHLVSRLFSAASKATHFKELRSYYFHNCIYGRVYQTESFQEPLSVHELLATTGKQHKLIVVGDALMAPYELMNTSFSYNPQTKRPTDGLGWLRILAEHFEKCVWLNPESPHYWQGTTIEAVARVIPMFALTIEGLEQAVGHLIRGRSMGLAR